MLPSELSSHQQESLPFSRLLTSVLYLRFLLDAGADPLIRDRELNITLHWSAYSGSEEITEMLLNRKCDINAQNLHGDTPL